MSVYATSQGPPQADGVPYAVNMSVPAAEGDLFNLQPLARDPIPVLYGEALFALVTLTAQGAIKSQTTYVILQTDLGDNNWVDLAWCTWTGITGSVLFVLTAGVAGANVWQHTRTVGQAPSPILGANQVPLGGRIRFVGKKALVASGGSSSSSSSSGVLVPDVLATITFKILGLR